jgi:hypothetical protein
MNPPPEFLCPITLEVMRDPVLCDDGHSYERTTILRWLATNPTSPTTRSPMSIATVRPNYALKAAIERWQRNYPSAPPAGYIAIPVAPVMQPLLPVQERPVSNRKLKLHVVPCICYLVIIGVIVYMAYDGMFG